MKKQFNVIITAIFIASISACGQAKHDEANTNDPVIKENIAAAEPQANGTFGSVKDITENYLHLKNALVNDDGNEAATAGKALFTTIEKADKASMTPEQKKAFEDIADDAKEHAEHIGQNAGKIEHQREHFVMLSKDIYDLIKSLGSAQLLYTDFCPMANDGNFY